MSNQTSDSVLLQAVKMLVSILPRPERAALRPWLLAAYQVDGTRAQGSPTRSDDK
jgi:hypothetical protein